MYVEVPIPDALMALLHFHNVEQGPEQLTAGSEFEQTLWCFARCALAPDECNSAHLVPVVGRLLSCCSTTHHRMSPHCYAGVAQLVER
jgi:hypothetical protein